MLLRVGRAAGAGHRRCLCAHGVTRVHHRTPTTLAQRAGSLLAECEGRAAIAQRRAEVADVHLQAEQLGTSALASTLGAEELCNVCRVLASGGYIPEATLIETTGKRIREALAKGTSSNGSLDAFSGFALAVCEAGQERGQGAELVEILCSTAESSSNNIKQLTGRGAAALALAAATTGHATGQLLSALLMCCSSQEMELTPANLGDLRLASQLAARDTVDALDSGAASFLQTVCNQAAFDDPRGITESIGDEIGRNDQLTSLEAQLSEVLLACEVPHSKACLVSGSFVPLSSHTTRAAFFPEEAAVGTAYANAPAQRAAWHRWRCRAVAAAGWRIFAVSEATWLQQATADDQATYVRQILAAPLDSAALS